MDIEISYCQFTSSIVKFSAFQHYVRYIPGFQRSQNILCRLVRAQTLQYSCDMFLGTRHGDWRAGIAVAILFWTLSLARVKTPFLGYTCPFVYLTIKVRDNYVNMIYCWSCCNTACLCILFHPYLDTGGVSCSPFTRTYANCTSESQSNARNSTYSATFMQPSVLPSLDRCGDVFQGRRSPVSSP